MGCGFLSPNGHLDAQAQHVNRSSRKTQKMDCRKKSTQFIDVITENVQMCEQQLSQSEKQHIRSVLKIHYLFNTLDQAQQIQRILEQIVIVKGFENQSLFGQGDRGNCFFIIGKGQFSVEVDGGQEKILERGKCFGEVALIYSTFRTAEVKCLSMDNRLFVIKSGLFRKTLREINVKNFMNIKNLINQVQAFRFLTNKQKSSLSNVMVKNNFKNGEVLFREGDSALAFYLVMSGKARLEFRAKQYSDRKYSNVVLGTNDSFGESSFYENGKRKATAIASQDLQCMSISRQQLKRVLGDSFTNVVYFNIQKWAIKQSQTFSEFSNKELDRIVAEFQIRYANSHEVIVEANKIPEKFVVCLEGKICHQQTGKMFCEEYFGNLDKKMSENIYKNDAGVYSILAFNKASEVIKKIKAKRTRNSRSSIIPYGSNKENSHEINLASFQIIKTLGQGQFGIVYLVRDPTMSGATYALKCIEKQAIIKQGMESSVISEKRILESISFSHIVGFVKAFSDAKYIYLLTEYIYGMEMFQVIREIGVLNTEIAQYYIGSLIISLEYLHSNNIIYRDVKPENSVVDNHGKVFLIDLGTAKLLRSETFFRTFTIIGTPHYLAPEVMQGKGYTFEVDYWSLGILLFQFLCARLPFGETQNDPYSIYAEVMRSSLVFPKFFQDEIGKKLINKLISKNASSRSADGGFKGLKMHSFFDSFSWKYLARESMDSPYVPKKFRGGHLDNHQKTECQNFLRYLYKVNPKTPEKQFFHRVSEWDEKFK